MKKRSYNQAASRKAASRRINQMRRGNTIMVRRNVMGVNNRIPATLRAGASEVKALDNGFSNYTINSTAAINPINLIQAGSSFFNRVGRRIEMKNVRVNGYVVVKATVTSEDYARIMIVYDRQTNGAVPAIADILQTTVQNGTNSTSSFSGVNLNNRDRFKIIRDMRIFLPSVTDTTGVLTNFAPVDPVTPTFNIDMFAKLGGLVTQFKADSSPAVIGDIATGGLYLITFGANASGAEGYQASLEVRLRYNDV